MNRITLTGTVLASIPFEGRALTAMNFVRNDEFLEYCGSDGHLTTWNIAKNELAMETSEKMVNVDHISEEGRFSIYTQLPDGVEKCIGLYKFYELDDLIRKGREIVKDEQLSDSDRIKYFIDNK